MLGMANLRWQISTPFGPGFAILTGLLLLQFAADAPAVNKQARTMTVVALSIAPPDVLLPQVRGLQDGLEEAGYTGADHFKFEHIRLVNEQQLRAAAIERLRKPLDVIVTPSATETTIAKAVAAGVPIVFAPARDPIELGFVKSYARPETNLTGLSYSRGFEDSSKQLAVFKQVVPTLNRVALLYPSQFTSQRTLNAIRQTARLLNLKLAETPIATFDDAERLVRGASRATTDGIFNVCSSLIRGIHRLTALADRERLAIFGCAASQVAEEGALVTYTPDIYYLGYRGAWYIDRILKGTKPQALPVEVPTRFELVVNLKVARKLGLKLPPQMLMLADKVFS